MHGSHITDDPERAGRYVLGRLTGEELLEIEEHLRDCPECRSAVETELRVAAAARRLGRDSIRARLRSRVARPRRAVRILAVAATIASLVGIGVVTRHLLVDQKQQVLEEQTSLAGRSAPTAPDQPSLRPDPQQELRSFRRSPSRNREVREPAPAVTAGGQALERLSASREKEVMEADAAGKAAAGDSFWTEGITTASAADEVRVLGAVKEKKESGLDDAAMKDDMKKGAPMEEAAASNYVLTQRPAAELPVMQQNRLMPRNSVPTLIRQRGDQTELILYLDSLVDHNELARARVEQRGTDSLVIRMQNQSIQYQLPLNRNRQQAR